MQRVALVTGGGSGIGKAAAAWLADQGLVVAVADLLYDSALATSEQIQDSGHESLAFSMDVASRPSVDTVVEKVTDRVGRIDVLVNAAGYAKVIKFVDLDNGDWERMMAVHATGTFNAVQAVVPVMARHGYGRIVCVSSIGALSGTIGHSHYSAAKAAVIGFAKAVCKEIGPLGITINCLAPGATNTPLLGTIPKEAYKRLLSNPIGRIGEPRDMAAAIAFLASEDAGFITGTVVNVSGGAYI